jgi:hypothetical protein
MDLAFTSTYFPHCGLTFAVLFGCTLSVEREVLRRLGSGLAVAEALHPLLIPGILAELERSRHVHIVEATIDHLETKIFELNGSSKMADSQESETEERNEEKRSAWLDTTYLRNGLISWNTQLAKMAAHANGLMNTASGVEVTPSQNIAATQGGDSNSFGSNLSREMRSSRESSLSDTESEGNDTPVVESIGIKDKFSYVNPGTPRDIKSTRSCCEASELVKVYGTKIGSVTPNDHFMRVGHKISDRIQSIIDEYNDKIRDCTMRVDGMAMATQWV